MASSKMMMSSSKSLDHQQPSSPPPSSMPQFTTTNFIDHADSTLTDPYVPRTVDDVWQEIIAGDHHQCKEEIPDEMMTLEDFLVKAGAVDGDDEDDEVKMSMPLTERLSGVFSLDGSSFQGMEGVEGGSASVGGFGNGVEVVEGTRGKRGRPVVENLDKAAQQRQRRMIKNRESAARSRERKQAYQVELESLAVKLEEENDKLLKEKAERTKERFKQHVSTQHWFFWYWPVSLSP
ncbi:G-box-binding factor 4-like isoform X3 [Lotus japonicus]|uniref:G-box-binding factor 4-like isoform X3 n=1 Tax=Lotus japonicus TaxID=34305 RepID=UPI00258A3970|nr:G-box-binding factor 4-like isoform X3 [Lotus japonicus]